MPIATVRQGNGSAVYVFALLPGNTENPEGWAVVAFDVNGDRFTVRADELV